MRLWIGGMEMAVQSIDYSAPTGGGTRGTFEVTFSVQPYVDYSNRLAIDTDGVEVLEENRRLLPGAK